MSVQLVMSFLYPVLAAVLFAVAGMSLLFWGMRRRTDVVLTQALCFFAEFITIVMLTLTTGANPMFDVAHFRVWIVVARFLLLFALLFHGWNLWQRIRTDRGI